VCRGMVARGGVGSARAALGRRVEATLPQGGPQEGTAQAEESQGFGGSYLGPEDPGGGAEQATTAPGRAVAKVVQIGGARLRPSRRNPGSDGAAPSRSAPRFTRPKSSVTPGGAPLRGRR